MSEGPSRIETAAREKLGRSAPTKAWWQIGGALVVVVLGAAAIGGWAKSIEGWKDQAMKQEQINDLDRKLADANGEIDSLISMVHNASERQQAVETKLEFLDQFLAYRNAPGDASKQTFSNFICALWKNTEQKKVRIEAQPILLTRDQVNSGVSKELEDLLINRGVPPIFFDHVKHPFVHPFVTRTLQAPVGTPVVSPSADEAAATIEKVARSTHVAKIVSFGDGTSYQVPDEIAYTVPTDLRCAPN